MKSIMLSQEWMFEGSWFQVFGAATWNVHFQISRWGPTNQLNGQCVLAYWQIKDKVESGGTPANDYKSPPGGRLPLLFARSAVTFPAAEHHRPLAGTKLYCLLTETHKCEPLARSCYAALPRVGFEPTTCWSQVQRSIRCATALMRGDKP